MITALQNFFLKHNKWLFGGLLVVIIVTFVLTIGPQSFFGSNSAGRIDSINYYGYDLTSDQDRRAMSYTAEISAILHPELQLSQQQLTDYAYMRVAGLGIASQLGIPEPTAEQLEEYVETLLIFADPATGEFSAETYNRMLSLLQINGQFSRDGIARTMREDYVIDQVIELLAGPDYALPFELKQAYIDQETRYTVALAHYDYVSFVPEIDSTEEALLNYFNENPARYETPETLTVDALNFKASAYLESIADPAEGELELYFSTNRFRYQPAPEPVAEGEEPKPAPEVALGDVRDQVVADWKKSQATRTAAQKAQQFTLSLYQSKISLDSPAYKNLLDENKVAVSVVPRYSRSNPPVSSALPADLLNSMWIYANNPSRYYSDAAQTADGAVVLVKRSLTPARMPEFAEVKDLVKQNFEASEKRRLFAEKGKELSETINTRLGSENFAEIAESLRMTTEELEQFGGNEIPEQLQVANIWDQTMSLTEGSASVMTISGDKGTISYMVEKIVPEVDTSSEAYRAFAEQRLGFLNNSMGWARLREIKDNSIAALLGSPELPQQ